jgi:hypothetical protein
MLLNVPASPSTSLPSISIRDSKRILSVSAMLLAFFGRGVAAGNSRCADARGVSQDAMTRQVHRETDHMMENSGRQDSTGEQHDQ